MKNNKHKFKIWKGIALVILIVLGAPMGAKAETDTMVTSDGFSYIEEWDGSNTYCITGYQGEGGEITIPGKIKGKKVSNISSHVFEANETLTKVTIGEGIEKLGNEVFGNCLNLTQIGIPASMKSTSNAFVSCENLVKFTVAKKNKIYKAKDGVLISKYGDTVILEAYPGGRKGTYTIPKEVTDIGEQAFFGAVNLTQVTIPGTCKSISPNAFDSCTKLNTVKIKKGGITYLGYKVFAHCTSLKKVSISSDVYAIKEGTFMGCTKLSTVNIDKKNKYMAVSKGVIYSKYKNNKTIFQLLPSVKRENGVFTVPNDVCVVAGGAFGEIEGLTMIDFSKSKVKEFEPYQWKGLKEGTLIIKKGSKLAKSIQNADSVSEDQAHFYVKYVK
ncbi:MAG: leucine-rich repeat domain-containing protein [Velocimicrobium sp.]